MSNKNTVTQKHIFQELSQADYITLLATLIIVIALWLLWLGHTYPAISLAFVSMFLDYLDGTIARKFGSSPYGKVLDSLYDILGFVLLPTIVVLIQTNWAWWCIVIAVPYHLSAALRLARFTTQGYSEGKNRSYVGVPVLFSKYALLVSPLLGGTLSALILAVMTPLMLSSRLVRKPHPFFAQLNLLYALIFLLMGIR